MKPNSYIYCSNENIAKTFVKYQTKFLQNKPTLKLPQLKLLQMEMQYIEENMLKYYEKLFAKQSKLVTYKIQDYYTNNPDKFNDYLLIDYKAIIELVEANKKEEYHPPNIPGRCYKSNYIKYLNIKIAALFQEVFVIPTLTFIENNYPMVLLERNIFPSAIRNLLSEVNRDQLFLKKIPDNDVKGKQKAAWSSLNSSFYYLEYNSFADLLTYRNHLLKVSTQYATYVDNLIQIIKQPCDRIKMYNKIKTYIEQSLSQFEILPKKKDSNRALLPNYIRKETLALLKHYIKDNFIEEKEILFNPRLGDFQDLQCWLGKKALSHVNSKIYLLSIALEKVNNDEEPSLSQPDEFEERDKINTELTVYQLAYFVRCLFEEKGILNEPNKMELFRKISAFIKSPQQSNMSAISLKNKSLTFSEDTINFCIEKLTHMMQFAKRERDKNFSAIFE